MMNKNKYIERSNLEQAEKWLEWVKRIPKLRLPDCEIQPIPPFAGAMARLIVHRGDARVSVYFDVNNSLGYFRDDDNNPLPYWEIYPYDEDTFRCGIDEVDILQEAILFSLERQLKEKANDD